jgi:hypothetical protein
VRCTYLSEAQGSQTSKGNLHRRLEPPKGEFSAMVRGALRHGICKHIRNEGVIANNLQQEASLPNVGT